MESEGRLTTLGLSLWVSSQSNTQMYYCMIEGEKGG